MRATSIDQAADKRRRDLAAIHASAKALNMDQDTYRSMLERLTGKRSSADLSAGQRSDVLAEMQRLGADVSRKQRGRVAQHPGKPHNFDTMPEMITKIGAQLADMKLPWAYAEAIAKRMYGIERIAWITKEDQLKGLIAALHVEAEKRGLNTTIDTRLVQLGLAEEKLVELLKPLRPNWRRHRASLRLVADYLGNRIEFLSGEPA
jgi:phage gp16-like protein